MCHKHFEIKSEDLLDTVAEVMAEEVESEALYVILLCLRRCFEHIFFMRIF